MSLRVGILWAALGLTSALALSSADGTAQTVTDVISFTGDNSLGTPVMTPAQGRNAEIYGTSFDPKGANGSVFSLTTSGVATVLFAFDYTTGSGPLAGLTLATDDNYYGATGSGGTFGLGVLFRISANGSYTVLHDFSGGDGAGPIANPVQASDGNLYGTTSGDAGVYAPTVYKLTLSGTFTTMFQFTNAQGKIVGGPLVQGSDGNLYGTAESGGVSDNGTIFKISTSGALLNDYSFPGGAAGATPIGTLVQGKDGNFYGNTYTGGSSGLHAYGTVFKMNRQGVVSTLYTFQGGADGAYPEGGLMQATDGNLYGTTALGGSSGFGTIFKISTRGSYQQLYSFTGTTGESPGPPPLQHTNGLLYGGTEFGGTYGYGVIYSLDMGLGPFITFVRANGKVGQKAQILGQGLTGTTSVTFNGLPASSFTVVSDTYMTAVVPSGATSGTVTVKTPSGTLISNKTFRVSK
jgi:uncharacterized repeat protein (TIGR03803 family)